MVIILAVLIVESALSNSLSWFFSVIVSSYLEKRILRVAYREASQTLISNVQWTWMLMNLHFLLNTSSEKGFGLLKEEGNQSLLCRSLPFPVSQKGKVDFSVSLPFPPNSLIQTHHKSD